MCTIRHEVVNVEVVRFTTLLLIRTYDLFQNSGVANAAYQHDSNAGSGATPDSRQQQTQGNEAIEISPPARLVNIIYLLRRMVR